jgi:trehalose 6-phosphate synthase/phosphatase
VGIHIAACLADDVNVSGGSFADRSRHDTGETFDVPDLVSAPSNAKTGSVLRQSAGTASGKQTRSRFSAAIIRNPCYSEIIMTRGVMEGQRLAIVSNRLPIVLRRDDGGEWQIKPGSGGLVTALGPVLRDRGGIWIGWPGAAEESIGDAPSLDRRLSKGAKETGYLLRPVNLTQDEVGNYYYGFANATLWPLFHDLHSRCLFDPRYWDAYRKVNRKFARAVLKYTGEEDYVWVHDYHLILVADELKQLDSSRKTGFFLHTPFPPLDIFIKLPWRFQILEAMMQYDLLGFQTVRDRRNFVGCIRALFDGIRISGRGHASLLRSTARELRVGTFPISIDFREFAEIAATTRVAADASLVHANLPNRQLILGIDRLDYTKGIPNRLRAFADALDRYPEMRNRISLIQVVVPSRQAIGEYDQLKQEIERLVGEINGRFTALGWNPVIYMYRSLDRTDLVGYYRACEIALITPLKDGMNLVAKEYCASSVDNKGVLILSEFAGAAPQLQHDALLVNPYDIEQVADAIHHAFTMEPQERMLRMQRLRRSIARQDIYQWVDSFLQAAISRKPDSFTREPPFVPKRTRARSGSQSSPKAGVLVRGKQAESPSERRQEAASGERRAAR